MEQSGYYRKYIILGELDPGFGLQYPPDGFVRIEGNREGITLSLQIRNLREGAEPYTVILVYNKNDNIGILRAGTPEFFTKTCVLRKTLDYDAVEAIGMSPENMQYVLIASEHPGRVNIPLVGLCNKSMPWNESIRQRLLRSEKQLEPQSIHHNDLPDMKENDIKEIDPEVQIPVEKPKSRGTVSQVEQAWGREPSQEVLQSAGWDNALGNVQPESRDITSVGTLPESRDNTPVGTRDNIPGDVGLDFSQARPTSNQQANPQVAGRTGRINFPQYRFPGSRRFGSERRSLADRYTAREAKLDEKGTTDAERRIASMEEKNADKSMRKPSNKVDDIRLERKLKDSFEVIEPFSNPRHDYSWYKVNDLAKLSNLLFACNLRIPLFANPKILVGLFKYRHLLAGFYRSDRNDMDYFVLGVPSKDDSEGKPFEDISLWVETVNPEFGDMTGYWLVYINLRSGDFVQ